MTLYEMLVASAEKYPDKIAVKDDENSITYSELKIQVDKLHVCLLDMGVKSNCKVGVALHNSIKYIIILYALSKNGNVSCLLNPQWSSECLIKKINVVNLDYIIVEKYVYRSLLKQTENFGKCNLIIAEKIIEHSTKVIDKCALAIHRGKVDYNVIIQSSSGTTGVSKMAYRSRENVDVDSFNIVNDLEYNDQDIIICPIPLCHGYGLTMGLIAPIRCGATIFLMRCFKLREFIKQHNQIHATIFLGIPEIYETFVKAADDYLFLREYKWLFCSGEPLNYNVAKRLNEIAGVWINQVYGMMEASTICINKKPTLNTVNSVGKPIKGVDIRLRPMGGDVYNIYIRGATVSKEYITLNSSNDVLDDEGWFDTQDLCKLDENGNYYLVGRKDTHRVNKNRKTF